MIGYRVLERGVNIVGVKRKQFNIAQNVRL